MEREQDGMEDDERGMNGEERFIRRGSEMGGGDRARWELLLRRGGEGRR